MKMVGLLCLLLLFISPFIWIKSIRQDVDQASKKLGLTRKGIFEERYYQILKSFLTGYNKSVSFFERTSTLSSYLEYNFTPYYRGFAYEGTGMGFGARSIFSQNKGKRFEAYINELDPNHLYQYYVGLGWWLHQIYAFRPAGYERWMKELDPRYATILFDGVGFKAGIFIYPKQPQVLIQFARFTPACQRVCYQGFGRSLWFQKLYQINEVLVELEALPQKHIQDTASGLGLAVAYSMFDDIEYSMRISKAVPEKYKVSFYQGMSFGWEARQLQNRGYWEAKVATVSRETSSFMHTLVGFVHEVREELEESIDYYPMWMDKTRTRIKRYIKMEGAKG